MFYKNMITFSNKYVLIGKDLQALFSEARR